MNAAFEADRGSGQAAEPDGQGPPDAAPDRNGPPRGGGVLPHTDSSLDGDGLPDSEARGGEDSDSNADAGADEVAGRQAPERASRPVSSGIGCAALLLPLIAVAGAVLCFAAGVLSAATGCAPSGSALCSRSGPWFQFALPLFVSPILAAATAIAAVTVRRHRSTWLAAGYGVVFVSVVVGLATASTGAR